MNPFFAQNGKIIINEKGEIGFSAPEIQNGDFFLIVFAKGVIQQLDESVDLAEFIVLGFHHTVLHFFRTINSG